MFVEVMKLNLGRDSEARFGQDFEFEFYWRCWCLAEKLIRFWRWIWSRFMFELVIWPQVVTLIRWTQPSGPLCLWQCLHQCSIPYFLYMKEVCCWRWLVVCCSKWQEQRKTCSRCLLFRPFCPGHQSLYSATSCNNWSEKEPQKAENGRKHRYFPSFSLF